MKEWLEDLSAKKRKLQQKDMETLKLKGLKFEVQNSLDGINRSHLRNKNIPNMFQFTFEMIPKYASGEIQHQTRKAFKLFELDNT